MVMEMPKEDITETFVVEKCSQEKKKPKHGGDLIVILYKVRLKSDNGDSLTLERQDKSLWEEFPPGEELDVTIASTGQQKLVE